MHVTDHDAAPAHFPESFLGHWQQRHVARITAFVVVVARAVIGCQSDTTVHA